MIRRCPRCDGLLLRDYGELWCLNCGYYLDEDEVNYNGYLKLINTIFFDGTTMSKAALKQESEASQLVKRYETVTRREYRVKA